MRISPVIYYRLGAIHCANYTDARDFFFCSPLRYAFVVVTFRERSFTEGPFRSPVIVYFIAPIFRGNKLY